MSYETRLTGQTCYKCGHALEQRYAPTPVYHNDVEWGWEGVHHDCVVEINRRIRRIETMLEKLVSALPPPE